MRDGEQTIGWGDFNEVKLFRPGEFGETKANPTITVLVCRAWALWRLTQTEWHKSEFGVSELQREEASLVTDIQDLRVDPPSLLGNDAADLQLIRLVPHVVPLLRP